ncbi:hypothetical protein LTR50_001227 [Elasticomyces elasticus]|nr:hypothetical protein LTR50_001227 [Elasticomyces elasticus]
MSPSRLSPSTQITQHSSFLINATTPAQATLLIAGIHGTFEPSVPTVLRDLPHHRSFLTTSAYDPIVYPVHNAPPLGATGSPASMVSQSSKRKQQTRLSFTPLPSSSPAASKYPEQIRDRAAAVTYNGSPGPAKRRRIEDYIKERPKTTRGFKSGGEKEGQSGPNVSASVSNMLPTPETPQGIADYDRAKDIESSDSEPVRPSQRGIPFGRRLAQQPKLYFGNKKTPTSSFSRSSQLPRSSPAQPSTFRAYEEGGEDTGENELSPEQLVKMRRSSRRTKVVAQDQQIATTSPSHSQRVTRSRGGEQDVTAGPSNGSQARSIGTPRRPWQDDDIGKPETSGDEILASPKRKTWRRKALSRGETDKRPVATDEEDDSDDDLQLLSSRRLRASQPQSISDVEGDEAEEDDLPVTPKRRKLRGPPPSQRRLTQEEQDDLDEDLEFLGGPSTIRSLSPKRARDGNPHKGTKQNALEILRRKRAGEDIDILSSPKRAPRSSQRALYDSDPPGDEYEGDELGESEIEEPDLLSQRPTITSREMFRADDDDEDFVVDEEDGPLGVPEDLPLAFTRYASMKPKQLFKYAVEWMVQKKINPAFQMEDEVYALAFRKLDDEVKGLAGSTYRSAAWTRDFTVALQARPGIEYLPIDRQSDEHAFKHKCEACNRSGHPPTWEIRFLGKPYNQDTLETVEETSSSSEEEDDDDDNSNPAVAYDAKGREVPPEDTTFYVGKFCMANARTAHALEHWRFHLNEWIIDYLEAEGYSAPEKIVERDKWSTKKRRRYAEKVADAMENSGEIRKLYQDYRNEIDEARNTRNGRWDAE